jgi:vacuolar-type H+-ATPase subunit I/STV1
MEEEEEEEEDVLHEYHRTFTAVQAWRSEWFMISLYLGNIHLSIGGVVHARSVCLRMLMPRAE